MEEAPVPTKKVTPLSVAKNTPNYSFSDKENSPFKDNTNVQEVIEMKEKLNQQALEIEQLKTDNTSLTKICEQFVSLVQRSRKKAKTTATLDTEDSDFTLKQLENYSILEKLHEWKQERGLVKEDASLPATQIPRPLNLVQDTLKEMNNP